jgi:hypothetical protein
MSISHCSETHLTHLTQVASQRSIFYLDEGATLPAGANALAALIRAKATTTEYIILRVISG